MTQLDCLGSIGRGPRLCVFSRLTNMLSYSGRTSYPIAYFSHSKGIGSFCFVDFYFSCNKSPLIFIRKSFCVSLSTGFKPFPTLHLKSHAILNGRCTGSQIKSNTCRASACVLSSNIPFTKQMTWPSPTRTGQGYILCLLPWKVPQSHRPKV